MIALVVAEFVREHGLDLFGRQRFEQGIVENDALVASEAREVGIAVRGPTRTVDDEDALAVKAAAIEQFLDSLAQTFVLELIELVE